ncbi:16S rRNA (uracil(1498)-N(3))-methyltransferase [Jatrophihabitans sp.]|uniref:16S rRNA (uracil(1498)-N(3))-methyltransferase n=1 Tax=Jatrophihabitans sp. TaxID=1932789 RepID=UPI002D0650DB|nr:16S rRNA (uracil(1498)-N(3))-methyltransferase [Jatrophihabitans sp.]
MTPPLFLVPDLGSGDTLLLTGAEAHHAATVTRLTVGEQVLLSDGRGGLAEARASQVSPDRVVFDVLSRRVTERPRPWLVVVQALPKGDRGELAVELLTELGADEIVPWAAARSIGQWKGDRVAKGVAKWQRTAQAAAKQSRRSRIPVVAGLAGTEQVAGRIGAASAALLLDSDADQPLGRLQLPADGELVLVVGPEGGLTPAELELFGRCGARPVRLGAEVLRTSTAGAAALAVLSVGLGRWS